MHIFIILIPEICKNNLKQTYPILPKQNKKILNVRDEKGIKKKEYG